MPKTYNPGPEAVDLGAGRLTRYRSASVPFRFTTCSSFNAALVGLRLPRSHWMTVLTAMLRGPARTEWLTPACSRTLISRTLMMSAICKA